jgi:hypothetical protein
MWGPNGPSKVVGAQAAAPGALADVIPPFAVGADGLYLVEIALAQGPDATLAAGDINNMELLKNGVAHSVLPVNKQGKVSFNMQLLAADTLGVKAVGAATAATSYGAYITLTAFAAIAA